MRARGVHIDPSLVLLGGSPSSGALPAARTAALQSASPCECPRCGYDVTGDIPNWTHACPLSGRCSECGLEFEWGVLFSPAHHTPRWSFEHVREGVAFALLKTGARTLWPGALWRTLRLEHPLVWRRLRWWFYLLLAAVYGACSLRNGLGFRSYVGIGGFGGISQSEYFASIAFPFWPWGATKYLDTLTIGAPILFLLVASVLIVLAHLVLSKSMARARVRRRHLWRIAAYSWTGVVVILSAGVLLSIPGASGWTTPRPSDPEWLYTLKLALREVRGIEAISTLAAVVWLGVFWLVAETKYLRIRHAPGVAVAVLVMGMLATMAIAAYTPWRTVLAPIRQLDEFFFGVV